ncbi:MAG: hypothetical protein JWO19_109 [Bryobacterales bacterium]|nr:hypothetical protein [Bryobacterales bacterium]
MPPKPEEILSSTNTSDITPPASGSTRQPSRRFLARHSVGGPIMAKIILGAATALEPDIVSEQYMLGRRRTIAESSTTAHEADPELVHEIYELLEGGSYEFFQDGVESEFSRKLLQMLHRHGRDALEAIAEYLFSAKASPDVASETLRRVADVSDESTLSRRWQILKDSLRSQSPRVRDGAILGFATLDDPRATSLLSEARTAERVHELQVLIDQVLTQLGRNR